MAELYTIEGQTLTDIGDALRARTSETRMDWVPHDMAICRTPNASGFGSSNFVTLQSSIYSFYTSVKVPNAATINVQLGVKTADTSCYVQVVPGEVTEIPEGATQYAKPGYGDAAIYQLTFENTDAITIYFYTSGRHYWTSNYGYYAEVTGYDADGNQIPCYIKEEIKNTFTPKEMAQIINDFPPIPNEADMTITGKCDYRFAHNGWNWLIDKYGEVMTTDNITNASSMFEMSTTLKYIPFDLNFDSTKKAVLSNLFYYCYELREVPKINNCQPDGLMGIFNSCYVLKEIPEDIVDWFDWSYVDNVTSAYSGGYRHTTFQSCYSLRKIPVSFLTHGNPVSATSYAIYSSMCNNCYCIDELLDIPFPHYKAAFTNDVLSSTVNYCSRLKRFTFALNDGQPYVVNWKSQKFNLATNVGWASRTSVITGYNSGITADKEVKDDETYQALKNDPDWFTCKVEYSRYNHDSAVETINSLPDTSAYLATAGGTNTIQFKKTAGSKTDGGAIENLTADEIAVATAKGWTVSYIS